MYIDTVHYCCEIIQIGTTLTASEQNKNKKSSKIPTEYLLLPGWEIADLTRLHVKETCFGIYTKDILHHSSLLLVVTTLAILC